MPRSGASGGASCDGRCSSGLTPDGLLENFSALRGDRAAFAGAFQLSRRSHTVLRFFLEASKSS
jgi:hypothetical protein